MKTCRNHQPPTQVNASNITHMGPLLLTWNNISPSMDEITYLFQTSPVQPLKFKHGQVILSTLYWACDHSFIHAGIEISKMLVKCGPWIMCSFCKFSETLKYCYRIKSIWSSVSAWPVFDLCQTFIFCFIVFFFCRNKHPVWVELIHLLSTEICMGVNMKGKVHHIYTNQSICLKVLQMGKLNSCEVHLVIHVLSGHK